MWESFSRLFNPQIMSGNTTVGRQTLESRGLDFDSSIYWISIGALTGFTILFNVVFTLALTFLPRKFHLLGLLFL